ncbi:MAG: hypothetical protein V3T02_09600, partial [Alphaproteobacteria bacterium]
LIFYYLLRILKRLLLLLFLWEMGILLIVHIIHHVGEKMYCVPVLWIDGWDIRDEQPCAPNCGNGEIPESWGQLETKMICSRFTKDGKRISTMYFSCLNLKGVRTVWA